MWPKNTYLPRTTTWEHGEEVLSISQEVYRQKGFVYKQASPDTESSNAMIWTSNLLTLWNKFLFLINHPVFGILAAHTNGPLGVLGSLSQQAQIKRKKKKKESHKVIF